MQGLLTKLRAISETTRLRILHLLTLGEFTVSELTRILNQSQPRVSRHLKLMADAGLIERHKEASWVIVRLAGSGMAGKLIHALMGHVPGNDPVIQRDGTRARAILAERRAAARAYFSANAENWHAIRSLHVAERKVEDTIAALLGDDKVGTYLDLGTGTGAVLQLLAPLARTAIGIDASREMLKLARAAIDQAGLKHVQVRHGDIYSLPFDDAAVDLITIHQVLHFLDDAQSAIAEAARVLAPGGRMVIADFAPHELEYVRERHAHRRLGISHQDMHNWCNAAHLSVTRHQLLPAPEATSGDHLTVSVWLCAKRPGTA